MDSSTSDNTGIFVFFIIVFLLLFVLPAWLMVRHHKKSKPKMVAAKAEYDKLPEDQKSHMKREGKISLATTLAMGIGVLIGSRALGSVIDGFILGVVLGIITFFIMGKVYKANGQD